MQNVNATNGQFNQLFDSKLEKESSSVCLIGLPDQCRQNALRDHVLHRPNSELRQGMGLNNKQN